MNLDKANNFINNTSINFNLHTLLENIILPINNKNSNFEYDFSHYLYNNITKSRLMNSHKNYTLGNIENITEFLNFNLISNSNDNNLSFCNQAPLINNVINPDYKTPENNLQSFVNTQLNNKQKKNPNLMV